jgi:nitroreductase
LGSSAASNRAARIASLSLIDTPGNHCSTGSQKQRDQLSEEQLNTLLDAALASPSANNRQPWHFSVVQNQELLNKVHKAASDTALSIAKADRSPRFDNADFQVFYHAPTVIFLSCPADLPIALTDCGIAVQNIALAAQSMGLGSAILALPKMAFSGGRKEEVTPSPSLSPWAILPTISHPMTSTPKKLR